MGTSEPFRRRDNMVPEIVGSKLKREKGHRNLLDGNLKEYPSMGFLISEYITNRENDGRIDVVDTDENNRPIIIEGNPRFLLS